MKQISNSSLIGIAIGALFLNQLTFNQAFSTELKADETVIFFTVDAYEKTTPELKKKHKPSTNRLPNSANTSTNTSTLSERKGSVWLVPLHAWVFEEEKDSLWRRKLTQQVSEEVGLQENSQEFDNLQDVLSMFLVDSESFKTLTLYINNQSVLFGRSGFNGHIQNTVEITSNRKDISLDIEIHEAVLSTEKRQRQGVIRLIPSQGISIISDIDDTIKDSHVLDKKELIKNTFLRPAKPVKSMNLWYQELRRYYSIAQKSNVYFHYVSASPWQLYPTLEKFLQQYGFPSGSLYLKNFRVKDSSILQFLKPSTEYKVETISRLIKRYPRREFILIGDSGEHDPEIYGRIVKAFPDQVKMIYIRKVPGSNLSVKRFNEAFKGIGQKKWQLFEAQQAPDFL